MLARLARLGSQSHSPLKILDPPMFLFLVNPLSSHLLPCSPRSGAWDAAKGLPDGVPAKKVRTAEEKDSVLSLLSSGEVDHDHASFLFNKVALAVTDTVCWLSRDRLYKRPLRVVHNYVKRVYKKRKSLPSTTRWRGGAAVGRRTCDREVASSIPGRGAAAYDDSGQVVHTQLPRR